MRKGQKFVLRRETAGLIDADEIRRSLGRRFALPLMAASLIAAAQIAVPEVSGDAQKQLRATPEPAINAPAFIRPPRPSPDVLMGPRVRIG